MRRGQTATNVSIHSILFQIYVIASRSTRVSGTILTAMQAQEQGKHAAITTRRPRDIDFATSCQGPRRRLCLCRSPSKSRRMHAVPAPETKAATSSSSWKKPFPTSSSCFPSPPGGRECCRWHTRSRAFATPSSRSRRPMSGAWTPATEGARIGRATCPLATTASH